MLHKRKRLPIDTVWFIKQQHAPYSVIREQIRTKWQIEVAKSTIRYYKRQRERIKPTDLSAITP